MDKTRLYTGIVTVSTVIMSLLPHFNPGTDIVLTGLLLMISSIFTLKKQRLSIEINDRKAIAATWILVGIAALGGINDILTQFDLKDIHYFTPSTASYLKKGIGGLILILNVFSKDLFPTAEGKEIQSIKADMKADIKAVDNQTKSE